MIDPIRHIGVLRRALFVRLLVLLLCCGAMPAALAATASSPAKAPGLGQFLDASGQLVVPAEFSGALDPTGYRLVSHGDAPPRFAPVAAKDLPADADARWSGAFSLAGCEQLLAMAVGASGEIYFGGGFSACGNVAANRVVRYDPVSDTWSPLGSGGGNGVGGDVHALAVVNGVLYAGGSFSTANVGADVRANNIARWDGSAWTAVGNLAGSMYGAGTNNAIRAFAVSGGDLYVGGFFNRVNWDNGPLSVTANRVARWDGTQWHALGNGIGEGYVSALLEAGGDVYVGGSFDSADGGALPAKNIARWNGTAWSPLGSGAGNGVSSVAGAYDLQVGVRALALWNGELYVGGAFARANIGDAPVVANNIARWDGSAWHALGFGTNSGNTRVAALTVGSDGLYLGGVFVGAGLGVGSLMPMQNLARWDGTNFTAVGGVANNGTNASVEAVIVTGTGLFVGGHFSRVGADGALSAKGLARWNGAWSVPGGGAGLGADNVIYALAMFRGELHVGGVFRNIGGVPMNRIARWDGTAWWPLQDGVGGASSNIAVYALTVHEDALYVGGLFGSVGPGQSLVARNVARWDGSAWSAVGSGAGNGTDQWVSALASFGGDLYVGGQFTQVNIGAPIAASRIARWDGSNWSKVGSGIGNGVDSGVSALEASDTALFVGGSFAQVNVGAALPARRVARWDGSAWSALGNNGGDGVDGLVDALAWSGSELYVGGNFNTVNYGGTPTVAASRVARWDGTAWSALIDPDGKNGLIDFLYALDVVDGQLFVGGIFTRNSTYAGSGFKANGVARWNGERWTHLGSGIPAGPLRYVRDLLAADADTLYVGGAFGAAGNKGSANFARYDMRGTLQVSTSGAGSGRIVGPGGIDCPGTCSASLPWDTPVTLVAEPAIDSELAAWSGDCSGAGGCTVPFERDATIDARFELRTFSLDYSADANGSIDGDAAQVVTYGGSGSAVTAVPDSGYHFESWSDGIGAATRTDSNITFDLAVSAAFAINTYAVNATALAHGAVTPPTQSVAHGDAATLQVTPDAHYHVDSVSGDTCTPLDNGDGSWTAAGIVGPCAIVATFAIDTYEIAALADGNGSITPPTQTVSHGGNAVFTVVADAHHHVDGVTGSACTPVDNGDGTWRVENIIAACTVTAHFAIDTYAVTLVVDGEGDVLPADGAPPIAAVPHGETLSLDVLPDTGHRIVDVTGCGGVLATAVFTTAPLTEACTVTAAFNRNPVATAGTLTLLEDADATAGQLVVDDDDATLTFELVDAGSQGTAVLLDAGTGSYTYTPAADANGTDTVSFRVSDGGATSEAASIAIEIVPVNDAPSLTLAVDPEHAAGSTGLQTRPGFATFVPGPANEATQAAAEWPIDSIDDPAGILAAASLAIASDGTLSYTLTGVGGEAAVTVRVRDDGGVENAGIDTSASATFNIRVAPSADLQVQKDDGRAHAQIGDVLVYAITVANAGPNAATGATLGDVLPTGLRDAEWACVDASPGATCPPPPSDAGSGDLAATIDLPVGGYLRFDVSATVDGTVGSAIVNTARIAAPVGLVDPDAGNDASTDTTRIVPDGIFLDGFEAGGSGLRVPAALEAHTRR